jgi:phage/plasmid-like protein (TIGR03299 family)
MSANVDSMFSVREVPWHREGIVLGEYPGNWDQARTLAGLDWEPEEETVYRPDGEETEERPTYEIYGMDGDGEPLYKQTGTETITRPAFALNPDNKHIVRSDTHSVLAVVGEGYTLINHADMGDIIEAVLGQPNVNYETAGSLNGGKMVWCLAKLDEPIELPGDASATYPYLAITNYHDGTGSCALRATAVRIVCQNTWRASEAEGERTKATFAFRHSMKWRDRIQEARDAVHGARREMDAYRAMATELLGIPFTTGQRELFIRTFIPAPPEGLVTDRVMNNIEAARTSLRNIFSTITTEGVADTAYGVVQAAGEYLDHVRTARTWETRLNRTLMRPEPLKAKALSLVREIVKTGV